MARTTNNIIKDYNLALSLDRYQEIMQLPINAFNGINNPNEYNWEQCSTIWTQSSRNHVAQYLAIAETKREQELGYHLAPKYITDEEHEWADAIILERKLLIDIGKKASTLIESGVTLTHRNGSGDIIDPVVLTVTTDVTDTDEIVVTYPGEEVQLTPTSVSISGGVATISIPRARLVDPVYLDDRDDHLAYDFDEYFLETVDVYRHYTTLVDSVELVWDSIQMARLGLTCYPGCTEVTQPACATTQGERAKRIATISAFPATFNGEIPSGALFRYSLLPRYVRVSYKSGRVYSPEQEMLTARYSHTLMPHRPCSCPLVDQYWEEDREVGDMWTPYGNKVGAIDAWIADSRAQIGTGGMFVA